jgi:hypothetical protein
MPLIRATFMFKDTNGAGWSETIYNIASDLPSAIVKGKVLYPLRINCLGGDSSLNEIRFSDDLVKRDSQIIIIPPGDKTNLRTVTSQFASNDLVCRVEGLSQGSTPPYTVRRSLALRGLPTSVQGPAGVYIANNGGFNQNLNAFFAELVNGGWAIRYRDKTVVQYQLNTVVQNAATGIVTITTQLPFTVSPNDVVNIRGVIGATEINGLWKVVSYTAPSTFTILLRQIMHTYLGAGIVNLNPYLLAPISQSFPIRTNTHRAGRPYDALRGRRKARAQR